LMHSWAICSQVRRITFVRASRWPGLSAGPAGRCGRRRPEQFGERRGLLLIGQHRCPCLPSAHRGDPRRRHRGGVRIWRTCHSRTCLRIQPRPCGACGRCPGQRARTIGAHVGHAPAMPEPRIGGTITPTGISSPVPAVPQLMQACPVAWAPVSSRGPAAWQATITVWRCVLPAGTVTTL